MQTICLIVIKDWEQLYHQLETVDPHQVNMMDFMADSDSDLPYESDRAYWDFSDNLIKILARCPDDLKEPLQTVFFSMTSRRTDIGQIICELPMEQVYQSHDWELEWMYVDFALSPASVTTIAIAVSHLNIGAYLPYFKGSRSGYINSFADFEEYANCWMAHFKEAHELGAGLICTCV